MDGWLGYLAGAAFLAGLAGGVHCAAMCGPIVACTAACAGAPGRWRRALAYNAGRILSYSAAGALAGAFGSTALALRGGVPAQAVMAALAGVAMLVLAAHLAGWTPVTRRLEAAGGAIWRRIQPYSRRLLPADTPARAFALGTLWGWLPCGMVYAAAATAIATARPAQGALVMLAFGLGTVPNLIAIAFAAGRLKRALHLRLVRSGAAAVVAGFGVVGLSFAFHAVH
jgi:sulfite exporter TauE/SafE